jgi:hypothetical protein
MNKDLGVIFIYGETREKERLNVDEELYFIGRMGI